eukprot:m51a1_g7109 hypothetical protein (986) ;mRNA; r:67566-70781
MRARHCAVLLCALCASAFDPSTRSTLVSGVPAQYAIDGSPSTLVLFSPDAVSLAVDGNGDSVAAAATYEQGKVCLFGHGSFITKERSNFGLVRNCLQWMKTGRASLVCSLNGEVNTQAQRDAVAAAGCTSTTSGGLSQSALAGVDVLFLFTEDLSNDSAAGTTQSIEAVRSFVRSGGSLVASGLGWYWTAYRKSEITAHPATALLAPCGLAVTDDVASGAVTVQQNNATSAGRTNLWSAFEAMRSSETPEPSALSTALALVGSLGRCLESGLDAAGLAPLRREAAGAFSAACSWLGWGLTTRANPVLPTDALRRSCMRLAWALPASVPTVDWAAESALFPGDVPNASLVTRTVTVPRDRTRWHSTALFVSAASVLTVRIPADQAGTMALQIGCHTDSVPETDKWARWQEVAVSVPLAAAETTVRVRFGGLLYIDVGARGSPVDVQLRGRLSDAPVFRAGATTAAQWGANVSATASPWGEVEARDVVFTLPTAALREVRDMAAVADYWQGVMDCMYHFRTAGPEAYRLRYVADEHRDTDWYMHGGYPIVMWLEAAGQTLMTTRTWSHWGHYNECGHSLQSPMWTFEGTEEVTNNLFSLYCERAMTGSWSWQADALRDAQARAEDYKRSPDFAKWKQDPWVALMMYKELADRWGWDLFMDLFREYDALPQSERPVSDDSKRDQWLVRTSRHVSHNLSPLFDSWGVPVSVAARQQVSGLPGMDSPDLPVPVLGGRVSLRSYFGTYVSAQDDGRVMADRTLVQAWEEFDISPSLARDGAVVIRSSRGKYLSANPGTHQVACDRDRADTWETFFPVAMGGSDWAFVTPSGRYLQALDSPRVLAAAATEPRGWETFTVERITPELQGRVSLRSFFNAYVSAQQDGSVQADRASVQAWEVFTVERSPSTAGAVAFRSAHGKYLSANPGTRKVACDRDTAREWEAFFPEHRGGSQWVFRATNGRYLQALDSPRVLAASNTVPQGWETFTVQRA